jgi:hypothetical protein
VVRPSIVWTAKKSFPSSVRPRIYILLTIRIKRLGARRVIAEQGIDYVAICSGAPEHFNFARAAPQGLAARLGRGEVPDYLEALPGDAKATLDVFRVRSEAFLRGTQLR